MKILIIHPHDINSFLEPWTRRVTSIAKELVLMGHDVKLAHFPKTRDLKPFFRDGYEVLALNRQISPIVFIQNIFKLIKLVESVDIVHFQKCHIYSSLPALIAAYIKGKPLHYDWDDWEEMIWYESCGKGINASMIGFSFKVFERLLPLTADSVSVASQHLKNLALRYGSSRDDIYIVPVGADLNTFKPNLDGACIRNKYAIKNKIVLYVGQLNGAQHADLFIRAAGVVLQKEKDITFMIVGGGFMRRSLQDMARELGISANIIFSGSVSQADVPSYIACADVCVASFRDTDVCRCKSPLKIVEYMSMGKAIVASDVGEARAMLSGNGILVEPDSYYALAQGIMQLINNKQLRGDLGIQSAQKSRDIYNWSHSAYILSSAYEKSAALEKLSIT